jgi:hypothetical protein
MLAEYGEYIVGIPAFILSSFLTWYIFYKQKKNKQLSYTIENIVTVVDSENIGNNDIEFLYKKKKVNYLEILTIRLINNGRIPITEKDFVKPIKIDFETTNILSARFEDIDKLETKVNVKKEDNSTNIEISFDLLNPKESIQIEVYLSQKSTMKISGRIVGINKINYLEKGHYPLKCVSKKYLIIV